MSDARAPRRVVIVAPSFRTWDLGTYLTSLLEARGVRVTPFACHPFMAAPTVKRWLREAFERNDPEHVFGRAPRRLQDALLEVCRRERPDLVLGLSLNRTRASTLREIRRLGARVAYWYVDCFGDRVPHWMVALLPELDLLATTADGLVDAYAAAGARRVCWVPEGVYLPAHPLRVEAPPALYGSSVAFVGNVYHPAYCDDDAALRPRLLKAVQARHGLRVWGQQGLPDARERWGEGYPVVEWPTFHEELVKVCQASQVVLGVNLVNRVPRYFSNRTFLTLASGGFHVTHYVPGLETMFENHRHLVWFHEIEECLELVAWYLERDEARREIADAGRRRVRARWGMGRQLRRLLAAIDPPVGGW